MARLHVVPSVGPYIIAATKPTDHSRCHVLRWEMMLVRKIGWKHGPRLPGVTCVRHQCSNQPRGQQSVALNVSVVTKCTAICQRSWPQEARSSSTVQFLVLARRNKCHKRRNLLQQAGANIRNPPCTTSYKMRSPNEFWKKNRHLRNVVPNLHLCWIGCWTRLAGCNRLGKPNSVQAGKLNNMFFPWACLRKRQSPTSRRNTSEAQSWWTRVPSATCFLLLSASSVCVSQSPDSQEKWINDGNVENVWESCGRWCSQEEDIWPKTRMPKICNHEAKKTNHSVGHSNWHWSEKTSWSCLGFAPRN